MEIATTIMSRNGQVVIPKEIRKRERIGKGAKFLVISAAGNILLKRLDEHVMEKEKALLESLARAEEQVRKSEYAKADLTTMSLDEIDEMLMDDEMWKSALQKNSGRHTAESRRRK